MRCHWSCCWGGTRGPIKHFRAPALLAGRAVGGAADGAGPEAPLNIFARPLCSRDALSVELLMGRDQRPL
ncbi:hypothetical protein NDU88_000349 [Pleurodeles waltl]|uniref:Uncharacterized protein n=1 Tax=Pleurodeles waltl TaxID=8319 RepID=A0AAV7TGW3_PLEWA|nr:hypothetical protein NDU88_000349 [Pleurodeles waltl]